MLVEFFIFKYFLYILLSYFIFNSFWRKLEKYRNFYFKFEESEDERNRFLKVTQLVSVRVCNNFDFFLYKNLEGIFLMEIFVL